ncbi:hypothetical protein BDZ97DRAFT_133042 [Flammula alnicola]|nr:hypothetical protein BDZ97DRAFT_133042 [Flammula alnicola]
MAEEPQFIRRRSASKAGWRRIGKLEKDIMWDSKMAEPPGGFPSVKKVRFPTSNWDWESWPESNHPIAEILPKGRAQKRFLLNDNDIVDLCYTLHEIYVPNAAYRHLTAHKYLCIQLERRSWEKYGGPSGFEAALAKKNAENPPANARGGRGRGRGRGAAANVAPRGRKAARGQDAHPNGCRRREDS